MTSKTCFEMSSATYALVGSVDPSEDWDLDQYIAKIYCDTKELMTDLEQILSRTKEDGFYRPCLDVFRGERRGYFGGHNLTVSGRMPLRSSHSVKDLPIVSTEEMLDSIGKSLGKEQPFRKYERSRHIERLGHFFLDPTKEYTICELSLCELDPKYNFKVNLPERFLSKLYHYLYPNSIITF